MTAGPASPHSDTAAARVPFRALLWTSLIASAFAAAATEAFSAVVRAAGVHLAVGDPGGSASSVVPVNAGACAISIAMVMVVGTGIAALISRRSSRPARTYVIVTSALALVSLVAPLTAAATSTGTKLTLVVAHLIAAAIIVPMVGRRLAGTRQDGSRYECVAPVSRTCGVERHTVRRAHDNDHHDKGDRPCVTW